MAETKNVYILRDVAAGKVKTGTAQITLRNGDIVAIGEKTKGVYALSVPVAATTRFGVVYNADVVTTAGKYRGLSDDPRDIEFLAGTPVNFYIPDEEDEVAITVATGYVKGTSKVLVPTVGGAAPGYIAKASATETDHLVYTITDEKFVSIGNERVKTIEAVCTLA
ncbi:MAG: hypothetical protein LBE23_05865 [Vagococcus sp.]|jgi:hypothetical protein|nr:hypothetical protein [Vagococcus sp.]